VTSPSSEKHSADHVSRLVQQHFEVVENELVIDGYSIRSIAERFGTPHFVYSGTAILRRIERLKEVLPPGFELYYSIKANPNAQILKLCLTSECGLEIASGGELFQALNAGCNAQNILFAGPGKSTEELAFAVESEIGEIHLESVEEARRLSQVAEKQNRVIRVAIRINPLDASGGAMRMGGQPSPFGIPEEQLVDSVQTIGALKGLRLVGVHLFMGTQILDTALLTTQYGRAVELAIQVAELIGRPLETVDFGGGLGTPYFAHERPLAWEGVASALSSARERMDGHPLTSGAKGIVEPGRFLVAESGVYVMRVLEVKESRGKQFAICDGGMHHHLAASGNLGQTIKRNFPIAVLNKIQSEELASYQIVGPLCTPLAALGRNVELPTISAGDLVGVFQSGAYARTASPHGFLSHSTPPEILTFPDRLEVIRRKGEFADTTYDQCCIRHSREDLGAT